MLSGEVDLLASDLPNALQHIRSGKVRALAVTGTSRSAVLPDVPTVQEEGVAGYEALGWLGIMAPAGTPSEIVNLLNKHINQIMHTDEVRARFAEQGVELPDMTVEEFAEFLVRREREWAEVIRRAGLSLD